MFGISSALVLSTALIATAGGNYQQAYKQADSQDKPLLVLVGAPWCPGCRVMKQETIPALSRAGGLREIVFTEVDVDERPELARQLLRGNSIPQLVLYTKAGKLWRRTHLTGAQSQDEIRQFLKREIAAGRVAAQKAQQDQIAQRQ